MLNTNRLSHKAISNPLKLDLFALLAALGLLLFPVQFGLNIQGFIFGIQLDIWRVFVFLTIYSVLVKCLLTKKPLRLSISNVDKWVYVFFGILIASIFWSLYPSYSARQAVDIAINLVFYIALINILSISHSRARFRNIWLMSVPWINGFLTIFYFVVYGGLRAGSVSEEAITISNLLAATSIMSIPILWVSINLAGPMLKRINVVGLIIAIVVIFFSQSRAGILASVFVMIATSWLLARQGVIGFFKVVFITVLIASVGLILSTSRLATRTYEEIIDRMHVTVLTPSIEEARFIRQDIGRAYIYDATKTAFKNNPVLGIGLRSLRPYIEDRFDLPKGWIAHGLPIEILTNVGLLGAVSFIILMFYILKELVICYKTSRISDKVENTYNAALTISFIAFILHSIFRPMLTEPYFFTFCAILSANISNAKAPHRTH